MPSTQLNISIDPADGLRFRNGAAAEGMTVSAWVIRACQTQLGAPGPPGAEDFAALEERVVALERIADLD